VKRKTFTKFLFGKIRWTVKDNTTDLVECLTLQGKLPLKYIKGNETFLIESHNEDFIIPRHNEFLSVIIDKG